MNHLSAPVVRSINAVVPEAVDGSRGAAIQILIGPSDGVPTFITRRFTLEPHGRIRAHRHDNIEHAQVIQSGSMVIGLDNREVEVTEGDCIFIPAKVAHWYENRSDEPVAFLCMVPKTTQYHTEWLEGPVE